MISQLCSTLHGRASLLVSLVLSPSSSSSSWSICSVTGNAKDIATTAIGWLAFSDFQPTAQSVLGIGISFVGAFSYSYVKLRQQLGASTVVRPSPAALAAEKVAAMKAEEGDAFLRAGAIASPLGSTGGTGSSSSGSSGGRAIELADVESRIGHRE